MQGQAYRCVVYSLLQFVIQNNKGRDIGGDSRYTTYHSNAASSDYILYPTYPITRKCTKRLSSSLHTQ